jgi:hypothetical protein
VRPIEDVAVGDDIIDDTVENILCEKSFIHATG